MNAILTLLYPALVKQSAFLLAKYPGHAHALQAEDLLHMAIERILRRPPPERMHEAHILRGLVLTVMKRVLVDEWRRNSTARRRDAASAVPLEEAAHIAAAEPEPWPEVNEALAGLVNEGRVDYHEALSNAVDKADLAKRCNRPPPGEERQRPTTNDQMMQGGMGPGPGNDMPRRPTINQQRGGS